MTDQDPDRPTDADRVNALQADYLDLMHAMQSGCEYGIGGMHGDPRAVDPTDWHIQKHLRVGINGALVAQSALCKLLIAKGVMTELEYWEAIVTEFRGTVVHYEAELSRVLGIKVSLR